jgi:hypothetical protein
MKKVIFVFLLLVLATTVSACGKNSANQNSNLPGLVDIATGAADIKIEQKAERNIAIAQAVDTFKIMKAQETDMENGPCLSNNLIEDWVLDIAHNPRQDVDNEPANQCEAYRSGQAHHFVELDLEGNLIRAE